MNDETPIQEAARKAGGQSALARALDLTPQAVQKWCAQGFVPSNRVLDVEAVTGVPRAGLNSKIYPAELHT
jgi:DNA-binding transcriptional regulator YdaS (Cro superfamily)